MTTTSMLPQAAGSVLIASPSPQFREQLLASLIDSGCSVQEATGGADALVQLEHGDWQLLFLDRRLPDLDAEELIGIIRQRFPGIEVVLLDSDSGQPLPVQGSEVVQGQARDPVRSHQENWWSASACKVAASVTEEPLPGMIGNAPAMQRLYQMVRLVARRTTTVLILGATGTGKELVASAIHKLSPRASRPFVTINCAAIPEALLESELFGHVRGAFTGAVQSHLGRIQAASGGTLFLDEIGELPPGLQAKLLRFLEQKEIQRLGGTEPQRVDVRVVAATNQDLLEKVERGDFREDLYYRLSAFPVELPLLCDRPADIVPLAEHFLEQATAGTKNHRAVVSKEAAHLLQSHPWPGNVRELQHVMERAAILAEETDRIGPEHLYFPSTSRGRRALKGWAQGALRS
jgi:DNA-binding NtrC family response regulator